ncbi:MAG: Rrf2 family transcriptional regulator [Isosphaeraceae bacterium]
MRISAKAEYACLALIYLAQRRLENRPVPIREIAEAQGIPETFLTQILLKLKGAGLVLSTRGSAGGYRLARSPEEISLQDVLTVVDGLDLKARETQGPAAPLLAQVWDQIRASEIRVLTRTSIAQLADRSNTHDWVI